MTVEDDKMPPAPVTGHQPLSAPLSILAPIPVPNFGYAPATPKRVLWNWSLVVTAAILLFLMWQCGSALHSGRALSDKAVRHFHTQLNSGQYEDICQEADEGFLEGDRHDQLLRLLEAVHRKLGNATAEKQVNMNVNATTGGTFITADYNTSYTQAQAVETFTWKKSGRTLMLDGYNIQSEALLK